MASTVDFMYFPGSIAPVEFLIIHIERSVAKLLVGNVDLVGFSQNVISQRGPWHGTMLFSEAKETTRGQDGKSNPPRKLINHQPLNDADFFAAGTANSGTFYAVTGDQFMSHSRLPAIVRTDGGVQPDLLSVNVMLELFDDKSL